MKARNWPRKLLVSLVVLSLVCLILGAVSYAATKVWPAVGAATVDKLRGLFGEQIVAKIEDVVLQTEDKAHQITYQAAGDAREIGWGASTTPVINGKSDWIPAAAKALSAKKNEAQWIPFLSIKNQVVAYRTFIAPDPARPYAFAALVAIDLQKTRLNFLLGTEEPKSSVSTSEPVVFPPLILNPISCWLPSMVVSRPNMATLVSWLMVKSLFRQWIIWAPSVYMMMAM
jgi:hypothetical protein